MSKYRSIPVEVDGIRFASKKEARRYQVLKARWDAGEIIGLVTQPRYVLKVNGEKVGTYVGDFLYIEDGREVLEDVKGVRTPIYRLKKKLMKALYGIDILET